MPTKTCVRPIRSFFLLCLIYLLAALMHAASAQAASGDEELASFVQHAARSENVHSEEITAKLPAVLPAADLQFTVWSHHAIVSSLERRLQPLIALYPAGVLKLQTASVLKAFYGDRTISFSTVFSAPAVLINPRKLDLYSVSAEKLSVAFKEQIVYGLRISASLQQTYAADCAAYSRAFRTIADLNARVAGFSHGKIIEPLSANIKPAERFEYNGEHDWSDHKRYRPNDQLSRVVELTNYVHASGERYVMSDHPDFSLDPIDPAKPVLITVFLWREPLLNTLIARLKPLPARLPDFFLQIAVPACKPA